MNPARPRRRAARPRLRPLLSSPPPLPHALPLSVSGNGSEFLTATRRHPATPHPACRARPPRLPAPGTPPASWPVRQVCPSRAATAATTGARHGSHSGRAPRPPDLSAAAARFTQNICGEHAGIPPED
ncbi:hypothetical protein PVAP13_4NG316550 [Panicum virgatum]|uniref:Uncharacterized protein n=1 Tax=Panicum virgatum TaxID=38727 RepID=A0A8T0T9G6_PANVG|nr:hypothetical protein PVAP13_4NG316550 [Panicum virgatum]